MKKMFYDNNGKIIYPIYSFKFLFFIFIFVHHCYQYVNVPFLRQPALAVSGFIIISGFLTGYIYIDKNLKMKEILEFSSKRIKKLYPLHLFMILVVIGKSELFNITSFNMLYIFIKRLLCNVFLIQSWVNDISYYFSFNGVSWFLSTYLFLLLITVPLVIILKRITKVKKGLLMILLMAILMFGITLFISYVVKYNHLNDEFYLYIFPPVRIFEYAIGIIFGILSKKMQINTKRDSFLFSFLEVLSISILILFIVYNSKILSFSNLFSLTLNLWIVPLVFLLVTFSYQKGLISKMLSFKPLVHLGEISMYAFLIHQPLINFYTNCGEFIHYRYFSLYMLIITLIISHIINKYYKLKSSKSGG